MYPKEERLRVVFRPEGCYEIEEWEAYGLEVSGRRIQIKTNFEDDPKNWIDGEQLTHVEIPIENLIAVLPIV